MSEKDKPKCKTLGHVFINNRCRYCGLNVFEWKKKGSNSVIKIIANHTREMAELQLKYRTLMGVHTETIKKYQDKSIELDDIKNKFIEDLDRLEMTVVIWDDETHLHIQQGIEMGKISSGMVFMPDITQLKFKWGKK